MTWCTYLQSFGKYINAFLSYSAKTKRDGQTDRHRQTDRQTDRRTDRQGALQYLPSRAFGAAGDNYVKCKMSICHACQICFSFFSQFRKKKDLLQKCRCVFIKNEIYLTYEEGKYDLYCITKS